MRNVDLKVKFNQEIDLLQSQLASADELEKQRLQSMIAFRKSVEAFSGYQELDRFNRSDFIGRACAPCKQVTMVEEHVSVKKIKGNIFEKVAAGYKTVALLYRFFNSDAKRANQSMGREGTSGVLGGYVTDGFYQSPKLFPEFSPGKRELSFFERLKRNSVGTVEMRNRYRRVLKLSLCKDRIAYFKRLKAAGTGTPENPIFIASIGGGTGSLEMDLQQHLREHYNICTSIVIFDVVDQNRVDGAFFAKMRGAGIYWIIQKPGEDDLLTRQSKGTLSTFLSAPLRGVDAYGNKVRIAADAYRRFHHLIMSGLWANFDDAAILNFLSITRNLLYRGAQAVATLSVNKYTRKHKPFNEKLIPALQIIDHLGHANGGVWYRSVESLNKREILKKGGFRIMDQLDGPIFPVIAIRPV